jgi:asparagine N-glycosylation enzyme membrane subunit Stt3
VKVFERVPGATVTGSGAPANATVVAQTVLTDPTQESSFLYRQYATADANGTFEMTLPYSTTGYEENGPETVHTNISVRADGPYEFVAAQSDSPSRTARKTSPTSRSTPPPTSRRDRSSVPTRRSRRSNSKNAAPTRRTGTPTDPSLSLASTPRSRRAR